MRHLTSTVVSPDQLSTQEIESWHKICESRVELSSPFYAFHFATAVASVRPGVRVCIIRKEQRAVAFLPFQFPTVKHKILGVAERVGGLMSDYFGLIAEPEVRLSGGELARLAGLSYLGFTHLDEVQLQHGMAGEQPEPGLRIEMPEGGKAFMSKMLRSERKFTEEMHRRQRALISEYGELTFHFCETPTRESLNRLIANKRLQYQRANVQDVLAEGWTRRLLHFLQTVCARDCQGVLSTLYAGETWVASHFGLRRGTVMHYWFPVYNMEVQRFGPGKLLLKSIIESADETGIRSIDQGAGESLYKRKMANARHTYYRGAWYQPNIRSTVYRMACSLQWRLDRFSGESKHPASSETVS